MAVGLTKKELDNSSDRVRCAKEDELIPFPADDARLEITYAGKASESSILEPIESSFIDISQPNRVRPVDSIPVDSLVVADNFVALNSMQRNLRGKVTLVYMDPPYGTGFEFQSRNQQHAYKDQLVSTAYFEFIRRRLVLLRELLSDEGSIYLHIGHQMVSHLKICMDEVFGPDNFRNLIVRRKCSSKNFTRKQYANLNDYVLFYTKSKHYVWNQPGEEPSEEWIEREYPKRDQRGRYKLVPVHAPGTRNGKTGMPWRGKLPPPGKHWQFTPDKLDELDANNEIHWSSNNNPRRKVYLPKDKKRPLTDYWGQFRDAHHQSILVTGYPTEKNLSMLKMIVGASSNPGDLVLDPFSGSGTTVHAAHDLGRHWIGVDSSIAATEAAYRRLTNGLEPMGDFVNKPNELRNVDMFAAEAAKRRAFHLIAEESLGAAYAAELRQLVVV